jgi:ABC-type ATPase involved in cell division
MILIRVNPYALVSRYLVRRPAMLLAAVQVTRCNPDTTTPLQVKSDQPDSSGQTVFILSNNLQLLNRRRQRFLESESTLAGA